MDSKLKTLGVRNLKYAEKLGEERPILSKIL